MLTLVPKSWLIWDFEVYDGSGRVADIDLSWLKEKGTLRVEGQEYRVYREYPLMGDYILELKGREIARAVKPSALFRSFDIRYDMKKYTLRARHVFLREFVLLEGEREVGAIVPVSIFRRRARVDLPEQLSLAVRLFMIFLTLILWRRAARD